MAFSDSWQEDRQFSVRDASNALNDGETIPRRVSPASLSETVRRMIAARRDRERLFSPTLFSDPAWDILLYLLNAEIQQFRVSFTILAANTPVPATTSHRWVLTMADREMLVRRADPLDARRTFIELHPDASQALRTFVASLADTPLV